VVLVTLWNPVGSPVTAGAAGTITTTVTPVNLGDLAVCVQSNEGGAAGPIPSGGGVATWINAANIQGIVNPDPGWSNLGATERSSIYFGIITATGSQTLTVTGSTGLGCVYQEFEYTGASSYSQDAGVASYFQNNQGPAGPSSGNFGPVTPSGAGKELLIGVAFHLSTPTITGCVSVTTPVTNFGGFVSMFYILDADTAGGPYSPGWSLSGASAEADFATCFEASAAPLNQIIMIV
jgi:hypothetical protein